MDYRADVRAIQESAGLEPDGVVGPATWMSILQTLTPTAPGFSPLSEAQKKEIFGDPTGGRADPFNPDGTFVPASEFRAELVPVEVPEWFCIRGIVTMNARAADQLRELLKAWRSAGLDNRVLSFGGSLAFRKVRGGKSLSSHAFGSAFDINVQWNPLGSRAAMPWEKGCLLELVKVANSLGWYWGGHFTRMDGMHFELAVV